MEEGRLFYHYLDGEEVRCERQEDGLDDGPRFRISIIGEDERIELRDLSVTDLESLRDQIERTLREHAATQPPRDASAATSAPSPGSLSFSSPPGSKS